jgi:hypothetical protein
VTKRLLGVDVADTTFKRDEHRGNQQTTLPVVRSAVSSKKREYANNDSNDIRSPHSRDRFFDLGNRGEADGANEPPFAQKLFDG